MNDEGPPLPTLLRWLGETPPPMRADSKVALAQVSVRAIVHDLCEALLEARSARVAGSAAGSAAGSVNAAMAGLGDLLDAMEPAHLDPAARNRLGWTLRLCWLLWNPGVRAKGADAPSLRRLMAQELAELAAIVPVGQLEVDADRREELIRRALRALGLRPAGESATQASERLRQVDSVETHRIVKEAEDQERRSRRVREELARKAAAEAAAKVSRE